MAVEVLGVPGESNGYGDSMDAFRDAHRNNSRIILNLAQGRKKNAPAQDYDPDHPANQWPLMVYHPAKGEKTVSSAAELKQAKADGYRNEPYLKPQIALLDPAAEKAALVAKNQELEGKLVATQDLLAKFGERLAAIEKS